MQVTYGTLIRWFEKQNFGFVRADESDVDYFIHVSGFVEKVAPPQNTRLKFQIVHNNRKPGQEMAAEAEVIVPRIIARQTSDKAVR